MEIQLSQIKASAKSERLYEELKPQIEQIQSRLAENHKNDLLTFKEQIKALLEEEIVGRYFLERGQAEVSFNEDKEILKSIELLNNRPLYKKILNF